MNNKPRVFMCDFETTVYEGQTNTEVWASACVELYTEDVIIFTSIDETFDFFNSLNGNIVLYYHNLKFDGSFWLNFLLSKKGFKQAHNNPTNPMDIRFLERKDMKNNTVAYNISDMGSWYTIIWKYKGKYVELRDSWKLLPFSVKRMGESFGTKHKKTSIEYTGYRKAHGVITKEEKDYIANDVLVVKEAIEIMFDQGHTKLTIGSCCMSEFKRITGKESYDKLYPNLYEIKIDADEYGSPTAGDYIRRSYRGGWCYAVPEKTNKVYKKGITLDVNSLYPSVMSSISGCIYPFGKPTFWKGNYIPREAKQSTRYFFIRVKCRFYIKKNMLPFVHIRGSWLYDGNENLTTSDVLDPKTGAFCRWVKLPDGEITDTACILTLTCTDYYLLHKHYDLEDFEILDGCYFCASAGEFDTYMGKYKKIKQESKGAKREVAKLFLNNLYGKMAASIRSPFKVAYINEKNALSFFVVDSNEKTPGYIAVGSAITSYAKAFTINAAQANYYGADKAGFIYADTDSIHCDLPIEQIKGVTLHDTEFCCWKLESEWEDALFVRQKTYIERTRKDGKLVWDIKCAGMPQKCKELFVKSVEAPFDENTPEEEKHGYTKEEIEFLSTRRTFDDFKVGLTIPSKLLPKQIEGGVLLTTTTYEMR